MTVRFQAFARVLQTPNKTLILNIVNGEADGVDITGTKLFATDGGSNDLYFSPEITSYERAVIEFALNRTEVIRAIRNLIKAAA